MKQHDNEELITFDQIVGADAQENVFEIRTKAPGPEGKLPLQIEQVTDSPSGDIFAYSQNAGMGWNPSELGRPEFLIISTMGGIRAPAGIGIPHWTLGGGFVDGGCGR